MVSIDSSTDGQGVLELQIDQGMPVDLPDLARSQGKEQQDILASLFWQFVIHREDQFLSLRSLLPFEVWGR